MYCTNPECPDLAATGRPGEYREHVEHCPVCGARLATSPDAPPAPTETDVATVEIKVTADPAEVQIVKTILDGAGIPYVTEGLERFSAIAGGHASFRFNPHVGEVTFRVAADRAQEARALLTTVDDA
jgi:hypothetical protein